MLSFLFFIYYVFFPKRHCFCFSKLCLFIHIYISCILFYFISVFFCIPIYFWFILLSMSSILFFFNVSQIKKTETCFFFLISVPYSRGFSLNSRADLEFKEIRFLFPRFFFVKGWYSMCVCLFFVLSSWKRQNPGKLNKKDKTWISS